MSLPVHPLLHLVESNANGLKLLLKNYIDFTVDSQFNQLKNSIVQMIATGQIGPQCNDSASAYTQTTFTSGQSIADTENLPNLHHSNDQLAITTLEGIKQECLEDSSSTIPINVHCNDAPNDEDNVQSNNAHIEVNHAQNGQVPIDEVKKEYDSDDEENRESYQIDTQQTVVNVSASVQPSPSHYQTAPSNASIAPSTVNKSNEHLTTDQITCQPAPLTTISLIKQEYDDPSSSTTPINVQCNDAPNDEDNVQSNNADIELNHAQNGQVPIDEVKEEYDDDKNDGEYMSYDDECEDCVKGICQLNQRHLVREINNTDNDSPNVTDNEHLENIALSVQERNLQDEFVDEAFDDDGENQLLSSSQQNNDHSNASIVPSTMNNSNEHLSTVQIPLPPTNQLQTSTKQSNNNLTNHNEVGDFDDCFNEIEEDDDETIDEQFQINQDNEESPLPVKKQKLDTTHSLIGQSQVNGQCPIETKQFNSQIACDEAVNQQSIPFTIGLQSTGRKRIPKKIFGADQSNGQVKSDKRKDKNNSLKSAGKVKPIKAEELVKVKDHEVKKETKLEIVTLELNCTEPGCTRISTSGGWQSHVWSCHRKSAFKQLEDNVRHNDSGIIEYACTDCDVVCTLQDLLNQHWKAFHQSGKFQCSGCGFVANLWCVVNDHIQEIHFQKILKQCTYKGCNKVYKNSYDLEKHERMHSFKMQFMCIWDKCQSAFTQHSTAIRHVRTHHFRLPQTIKEQNELNIIDEREPREYVKVVKQVEEILQKDDTKQLKAKLNCTEPGCKAILNSLKLWKEHLLTNHGQMP